MEFFRNILRNRSSQTKPQPSKTMNTVDSSKNAHTEKDITMKRIQTLRPVRLLRFIYALVACTLIDATVGAGAAIAADESSKVTLVYELARPMCPAKASRACSLNMVPEVRRRRTRMPNQLSSMRLFSKERSEVRSMMGQSLPIAPARASPRCPVTGTPLVRMRARPDPRNCWPCSWSTRTKRNC